MKFSDKFSVAMLMALTGFSSVAEEKSDEELADMSDPLAVFTQAGVGGTDKAVKF